MNQLLIHVTDVVPLGGYRLRITFSDGATLERDLAPLLTAGCFRRVSRDPALFGAVQIDPELGVLSWPDDHVDIDTAVLRYDDLWHEAIRRVQGRPTGLGTSAEHGEEAFAAHHEGTQAVHLPMVCTCSSDGTERANNAMADVKAKLSAGSRHLRPHSVTSDTLLTDLTTSLWADHHAAVTGIHVDMWFLVTVEQLLPEDSERTIAVQADRAEDALVAIWNFLAEGGSAPDASA